MKNPITDKTRPSLACLGMHYILMVAFKKKRSTYQDTHGEDIKDLRLTYSDIQIAMESKFPPDQAMQKQLQYLASYGYIKQENQDGIIYITLL